MPTILTHALLPVIGAAAVPRLRLSKRLVVAAVIVAMLPDADVAGRFLFGYPGTHPLGHRGWTHSIGFGFLVGAIGAAVASALQTSRRRTFAILFLSALSHALTDMLTNGGRGVMLLWPLSVDKVRWPVRPVEIAPLGLRGFEDGRIWDVLASEALWLLAPAIVLALLYRFWSAHHIDSLEGET